MHKVKRTPEPKSLIRDKTQWTKELLDEIKVKGSYKKVCDKYKNQYKQQDVLESLELMYSHLCCFCEGKIGASGYERIEHLKPKALPQFHHLSFEWNNLNLSCEICNTNKGDKWDDLNPILDPSEDDISSHLKFCYDMIDDLTPRGRTTIDHCKLNRNKLVNARTEILATAMRLITRINHKGDISINYSLRDELLLMVADDGEYCSFINSIIKEYLKPV